MSMTHYLDTEQALEYATVELFRSLGYEALDAYHETPPPQIKNADAKSNPQLRTS
jgi:hypothetical protein